MPLADIAKKLKKDVKKNKKGANKPGKKPANNKQGKGNASNKGTPNKVKGGVGKVINASFSHLNRIFMHNCSNCYCQSPKGQKSPTGTPKGGKSPKGQVS